MAIFFHVLHLALHKKTVRTNIFNRFLITTSVKKKELVNLVDPKQTVTKNWCTKTMNILCLINQVRVNRNSAVIVTQGETDNYRLLTVLTTSIILDNRARIVKIDLPGNTCSFVSDLVVTLKPASVKRFCLGFLDTVAIWKLKHF